MGSPYDKPYTVPAEKAPMWFKGVCYGAGEVIMMNPTDFESCGELINDYEDEGLKCFPEYCVGKDGAPTTGYRVPVTVPAGAIFEQPVAAIEGCRPPAMVCFHYCANCLYVGYDSPPIVDPEDPIAQAGGGADPNPTCRDLVDDKTGECVEVLHIYNPSDVDVLVTLSYYC